MKFSFRIDYFFWKFWQNFVSIKRPPNPVEYLALFLLKNNPKKAEEEKEKQEQENAEKEQEEKEAVEQNQQQNANSTPVVEEKKA